MAPDERVDPRPPSAVLAESAVVAGLAPSIHNTQPWRWRVRGGVLDLHTHRKRQLVNTDPDGRMLTISCGAALHYVRVALAAEGWEAEVDRFPVRNNADLVARLTLGAHVPADAAVMRAAQALRLRRTDRRPVADVPVALAAIRAVRQAAVAEHVDLHQLTGEQVGDLAAAATRAAETAAIDSRQRTELRYWTGGFGPAGTGIPDASLPEQPPQTTVPGRDFTRAGSLTVGPGHDREAVYLILFGAGDQPVDWLRAGEAMSAAWIEATQLGLTVLPLSSVIEVPATREAMRRVLSDLGYPYLVLRLGAPDPDYFRPPQTPRLPAEQIVEIVP